MAWYPDDWYQWLQDITFVFNNNTLLKIISQRTCFSVFHKLFFLTIRCTRERFFVQKMNMHEYFFSVTAIVSLFLRFPSQVRRIWKSLGHRGDHDEAASTVRLLALYCAPKKKIGSIKLKANGQIIVATRGFSSKTFNKVFNRIRVNTLKRINLKKMLIGEWNLTGGVIISVGNDISRYWTKSHFPDIRRTSKLCRISGWWRISFAPYLYLFQLVGEPLFAAELVFLEREQQLLVVLDSVPAIVQ